ncbi:hypothetical protein Cgig2_017785 [Carnegiea gigantea]|uniref:Uncharacterized protein n=1 Tax=Carnegiea gigantea TaxID=171969 RepID=A0A9Q1QRE8_9CARY|nr:hypothetical protein Cgig2_017785 [Carnegiea gigantea]
MATSLTSAPISGGLKKGELSFPKCSNSRKMNGNSMMMKSNRLVMNRKLVVRAEHSNDRGRGGADFVAGFFLGGAVCGTLAYIFAPQAGLILRVPEKTSRKASALANMIHIRRVLLNEDEYGFRKPRRPIYYEEEDGLEKTRQILNAKLRQLNAAIDNVSSRLRGVNNVPPIPVEPDSEVEATK